MSANYRLYVHLWGWGAKPSNHTCKWQVPELRIFLQRLLSWNEFLMVKKQYNISYPGTSFSWLKNKMVPLEKSTLHNSSKPLEINNEWETKSHRNWSLRIALCRAFWKVNTISTRWIPLFELIWIMNVNEKNFGWPVWFLLATEEKKTIKSGKDFI